MVASEDGVFDETTSFFAATDGVFVVQFGGCAPHFGGGFGFGFGLAFGWWGFFRGRERERKEGEKCGV